MNTGGLILNDNLRPRYGGPSGVTHSAVKNACRCLRTHVKSGNKSSNGKLRRQPAMGSVHTVYFPFAVIQDPEAWEYWNANAREIMHPLPRVEAARRFIAAHQCFWFA